MELVVEHWLSPGHMAWDEALLPQVFVAQDVWDSLCETIPTVESRPTRFP